MKPETCGSSCRISPPHPRTGPHLPMGPLGPVLLILLWNSIPLEVRTSGTIQFLKQYLKYSILNLHLVLLGDFGFLHFYDM